MLVLLFWIYNVFYEIKSIIIFMEWSMRNVCMCVCKTIRGVARKKRWGVPVVLRMRITCAADRERVRALAQLEVQHNVQERYLVEESTVYIYIHVHPLTRTVF